MNFPRHIVLIFTLALAASFPVGVAAVVVNLGQSAALTGSRAYFGIENSRGLALAFREANDNNFVAGVTFNFTTLDDVYVAATALSNSMYLIDTLNVTALVGQTGSSSAEAVVAALNSTGKMSVPFIGSMSGAASLRIPFQENIINIRPSYGDETGAIVKFLLSKQVTRVALLQQNNVMGANILQGLKTTLAKFDLEPYRDIVVDTSSFDVAAPMDAIFDATHAQACVFSTSNASYAARAIHYARTQYDLPLATTYFVLTSFVDPQEFNVTLAALGGSHQNIYMTSTVPPPWNSTLPIATHYMELLQQYYPGVRPTFTSFEGYVTGQLVVEVIDRIRGPINRANFLESLYRSSVFYFGGFILGTYIRQADLPQCNEGAMEVFLNSMGPDGQFSSVPGFSYRWLDSCLSSVSTLLDTNRITWGQTAGFSGYVGTMARQYNKGILAAFTEANSNNAILGTTFHLVTLQDDYNETIAYSNAIELIQKNKVFGFVGAVGTATSEAALQAMHDIGASLPFVGAVTGAPSLHAPEFFQRVVVNIRASYLDEAAAMVSYLADSLVTRVSVLYSDNPFGSATFTSVQTALSTAGLSLASSGVYNRLTSNISEAVGVLLAGAQPEAIFLAGTAPQMAEAVSLARARLPPTTRFLAFSIVGTGDFYTELKKLNQSIANILIAQVVPFPDDTTDPLVIRYRAALENYDPQSHPSFESLEGYLSGLLIVEACSRIHGTITPDAFVNIIYEAQLYMIERHQFGPFYDAGSQQCNQGLRQVWLSQFNESATDGVSPVFPVPDSTFRWFGSCLSTRTDVLRPLLFGQSADLTGAAKNVGTMMRLGILAAFNRFNRNGGLDGRPAKLLTLDDQSDATLAAQHAADMIRDNVVALIGFVGTEPSLTASNVSHEARVPFLAPYSGATSLRKPCRKYLLNMRCSYDDENSAALSFLLDDENAIARGNRTFSKIAVVFQQQASSNQYYDGLQADLKNRTRTLFAMGSFDPATEDVQPALRNITLDGNPDVIFLFCRYSAAAKFIELAQRTLPPSTVYIGASVTAAEVLAAELVNRTTFTSYDRKPVIYSLGVMPSPTDTNNLLAAEYQQEMALLDPNFVPNHVSFEGYAAGRFATRALQVTEGEITHRSYTDAIYEKFIFNLNEFYLGPFTVTNASSRNLSATEDLVCDCSQGSHRVWLSYISDNFSVNPVDTFSFSFESCGVEFKELFPQSLDPSIRSVILLLTSIVCVLVIICGILLFIYRNTKTMVASSPMFMGIILLGALLLAMSPFFAVKWTHLSSVDSDNFCMTWVWLLGLGFTLFFAPLAIKTYRVWRIFNNRLMQHVITIKDKDLLLYLTIPLLIELIILILWTSIAPEQLLQAHVPGTLDQVVFICTSVGGRDQPFIIVQSIFFGLLALAACFFAFKTRNIKYGAFKESTEILFGVYNLTFLSIILVPLHAALTYYIVPSSIIRTIGVLFQLTVSLIAIFGIKLYRIITNNEKMSTNTRPSGRSSHNTNVTMSTTSSTFHPSMVDRESTYSVPASTGTTYIRSENTAFSKSENTTYIRSENGSVMRPSEYESESQRAPRKKAAKLDLSKLPTLETLSNLDDDDSTGQSSPSDSMDLPSPQSRS